MGKSPEHRAAVARANGAKGGRPKNAINVEKFLLHEMIRPQAQKIVDGLWKLARYGKDDTIKLGAYRELLDRGFGKPFQAVGVGIGDGQAIVTVITGCRERDPLLPPPRDLFANLPPSPRPCIDGETSGDP